MNHRMSIESERCHSQIEQLDLNSNNKCIGNRKIRTIMLCLLLEEFSILATPHSIRQHMSSFLQLSGLLFILICSFISMIRICTLKKKTKHHLSGFGILFGSILYFSGYSWYMFSQTPINISHFALIGEAFLYASTGIILGIDILLPSLYILNHPHKRLLINFIILCIVSIFVIPSAVILDSVGVIFGSGYIIICIATLIYIILILAKCFSFNKLHYYLYLPIIRIILAIALMIGGVITCIGYYIFASDGVSLSYPYIIKHYNSKRLLYYIGYIIFIGGLCIMWSLDIITTLIYLNDKLNEINNNQSYDNSIHSNNHSNRYTITHPESIPELQTVESHYSEVGIEAGVKNKIPPPYNPDAHTMENADNPINEGSRAITNV
eukprot:195014_1